MIHKILWHHLSGATIFYELPKNQLIKYFYLFKQTI